MAAESRVLKMRAFGPLACFTRPEFKVERMSYEVITPSAARGLLEAVLWKPAIRWQVQRIHVLRHIRFTSFKRNEVNGGRANPTSGQIQGHEPATPFFADDARAQRSTLALADVDYVIEATIKMTTRAGEGDNILKFTEMFERRLEKGQWFHPPYFGCREFAASVEPAPVEFEAIRSTKPLGLMLHDIQFEEGGKATPHFFPAVLRNGVVDVPPFQPLARAEVAR